MGIVEIMGKWAKAGFGLRRNLQETKHAILVTPKYDWVGLGYKPKDFKRKKMNKKKKKKKQRIAEQEDGGFEDEPMVFPHLHKTFWSTGYDHTDSSSKNVAGLVVFSTLTICTIGEDKEDIEKIRFAIRPMASGYKMDD